MNNPAVIPDITSIVFLLNLLHQSITNTITVYIKVIGILGMEKNNRNGTKNKIPKCQILNLAIEKNEDQARKKNGNAIVLSIVIMGTISRIGIPLIIAL